MFINKKYVDTRVNSLLAKIAGFISRVKKIEITKVDSDDARLSDARAPLIHEHSELITSINNINTLLTSSDTTLDDLQEVVNFIKQNKSDLDNLTVSNISGLQSVLDNKSSASHNHNANYEAKNTNIQSHISATSDPHNVTKSQVGLGSVNNTSDANKEVSNPTQTALNGKSDTDHTHSGSTGLIDAAIIQAIPYQSTPTAQPVSIQITGTGWKTLTIWKGNNVGFSIGDTGCSVTQENPYVMSGSVENLNLNLAAMTITAPVATFPQDQACIIKIGVDLETKEIVFQPVNKTWQ